MGGQERTMPSGQEWKFARFKKPCFCAIFVRALDYSAIRDVLLGVSLIS